MRSRDLPAFRYVAIQPARIEARERLGPASYLHDFLVDHQTDAAGNVNYGKPFGYAWIRSRWLQCSAATHAEAAHGAAAAAGRDCIEVMGFGAGMKVKIVNSAKWARPQVIPRRAVQYGHLRRECVTDSHGAKNGPQRGPKVAP